MLYLVSWTIKPENVNAAHDRVKRGSGIKAPKGVKIVGRWHTVTGQEGFAVTESDDPKAMFDFFNDWDDLVTYSVRPVLTDDELFG